jgi:hypothetical protein
VCLDFWSWIVSEVSDVMCILSYIVLCCWDFCKRRLGYGYLLSLGPKQDLFFVASNSQVSSLGSWHEERGGKALVVATA